MFFFFIFFFFFFNFWNLMILFSILFMIVLFFYPSIYIVNLNKLFFLDGINFWLVLLTLWIIFLMFMSMNMIKFKSNNSLLMGFMLVFLFIFLFFSFLSFSYLNFYIFFEMTLIPTLYLIVGWGYQPERILAGFYLLFYTLLASLPLLISILMVKLNFNILLMLNYNFLIFNNLMYFSMVLAFLVKMPMFLVHLWLPKAHVEAPISGSMILAAILLKLGGYGLLRVMSFFLLFGKFNLLLMLISVFGGILISVNCLRQLDLKLLIAYSSVAHMGMVLGGMFTLTFWGVNGGFLMMVAHGLCSSGLFCLANFNYERLMSRSMLINKGLMNFMPSLALWWFLLCSSNMSAPMSLNLISEIMMINSILSWSLLNLGLLFLLCFFSASYCYYLYSFSQHGFVFSSIYSFSMNNQREYLIMMFHWFPLNILFLNLMFIM